MKIKMITPAAPGSRAGNRATAERWQRLLAQLGHEVSVVTEYHGEPCDLLVALHAWRSADAVRTFRRHWPDCPLIVALTGTDIYRHQHEYPEDTLASMATADALIGLHSLVAQDIPMEYRDKLVTLYQSAPRLERPRDGVGDPEHVDVCVIGHLRDEKDSLRAALAARLLPPASRIRILCAGKPHDAKWLAMAEQEATENPRFRWLGELGQAGTAELMIQSRLMVISSVMEGGANVVSEACRAGLPIIASNIPGNRGLLGEDYPGYYPVGDQYKLAELLEKTETEPAFLEELTARVAALAHLFTAQNERHCLEQALALAVRRHPAPGKG